MMELVIVERKPGLYRAVFLNGKRTLRAMRTIEMLANVAGITRAVLVALDGGKTRIEFGTFGWRILK
jgi:hypothetical protein